jgi:hypothetical protein
VAGFNFTIAGTLYSTANGGAAIAGATVVVTDNNGQKLQLVTCTNGNFYTTTPVAFPVRLEASDCPPTQQMSATASKGSCNTGGCLSLERHAHSSPVGRRGTHHAGLA